MRTYRHIPLYYLHWSFYILTPTILVQGVDNLSWGLYCRRCYCIRVCWGPSSRIFHFSRWLGQLSSVLTKDESPHTGYTFTPWVVSFTPPRIEHQVGGTSILRLIWTTMKSTEKKILRIQTEHLLLVIVLMAHFCNLTIRLHWNPQTKSP